MNVNTFKEKVTDLKPATLKKLFNFGGAWMINADCFKMSFEWSASIQIHENFEGKKNIHKNMNYLQTFPYFILSVNISSNWNYTCSMIFHLYKKEQSTHSTKMQQNSHLFCFIALTEGWVSFETPQDPFHPKPLNG